MSASLVALLAEANKLKGFRGIIATVAALTLTGCGGGASAAPAGGGPTAIRQTFGGNRRAWCIARRESRLQPRAVHVNADGSVDRGLFQINSVWIGHLVQFYTRHHGVRIVVTKRRLFDALSNTRIAWAISHAGVDWRPWTTSGAC